MADNELLDNNDIPDNDDIPDNTGGEDTEGGDDVVHDEDRGREENRLREAALQTVVKGNARTLIKLIRKRATTRGSITKAINKIELELKSPTPNEVKVEEGFLILEIKGQEIISIDDQIEDLIPLDVDKDKAAEEAEEWTNKVLIYKDKVTKWKGGVVLTPLAQYSSGGSSVVSGNGNLGVTGNESVPSVSNERGRDKVRNGIDSASIGQGNNGIVSAYSPTNPQVDARTRSRPPVRLPKIEIKKYVGGPDGAVQWQGFWEQFERAVHDNPDFGNTDKFVYLKSYLGGEAERSIEGLRMCNDNYPIAINILKERYGARGKIISHHMNNVVKLSPVESTDLKGLRTLYDTCQVEVRSLESLNAMSEQHSELLAHMIGGLLPIEMLEWFSREKGESDIWHVDDVLSFLRKEITCRERAVAIHRKEPPSKRQKVEKTFPSRPSFSGGRSPSTAGALAAGVQKRVCVFCESVGHPYYKCKKLTAFQKRGILLKKRLCFSCMSSTHQAFQCQSKFNTCRNCGKKHHQIICEEDGNKRNETPYTNFRPNNKPNAKGETRPIVPGKVGVNTIGGHENEVVLLQTAKALIKAPSGNSATVRCLLDDGAHRCFILEDLSKNLGLEVVGEATIEVYSFGSSKPATVKRREVLLSLIGVNGQEKVQIRALETPEISGEVFAVPSREIAEEMQGRGMEVADMVMEGEFRKRSVDILIGSDFLHKITTTKVERLNGSLTAHETIFGWTVRGPTTISAENVGVNTIVLMTAATENVVADRLKAFWDVEAIGITDLPDGDPIQKHEVLEKFEKTISNNKSAQPEY